MIFCKKGDDRNMFNYNKLKELRKNKDMLQKDLAKVLNVSVSTVSMWEVGSNQPSGDDIKKIANLFNVSTDYLLDNEDSKTVVKNNEVLQEVADKVNDPLNRALYKKVGELKTDEDKKRVYDIINTFINNS